MERTYPEKISPQEARKEIQQAGYEPLEAYSENTNAPWEAKCVTCGKHRRVRLRDIRRGRKCSHIAKRVTPESAKTELQQAGYEPMEDFPGRVARPWKVRCEVSGCNRILYLRLSHVRTQRNLCHHGAPRACRSPVTPQEAREEARRAGYEPTLPYPGTAGAMWPLLCIYCQRVRWTALSMVRMGERCTHRLALPVQARAERVRESASSDHILKRQGMKRRHSEPAKIRAWASEQGYEIGNYGPIPARIHEAYKEAQSSG